MSALCLALGSFGKNLATTRVDHPSRWRRRGPAPASPTQAREAVQGLRSSRAVSNALARLHSGRSRGRSVLSVRGRGCSQLALAGDPDPLTGQGRPRRTRLHAEAETHEDRATRSAMSPLMGSPFLDTAPDQAQPCEDAVVFPNVRGKLAVNHLAVHQVDVLMLEPAPDRLALRHENCTTTRFKTLRPPL